MKTKTFSFLLTLSLFLITSCGFNKMPKSTDRMADTTDRMATTTEKMALSTDTNMAQMNKNFEQFTDLAPLIKELLINFNKMTPEVQQMLKSINEMTPDAKFMMAEMSTFIKSLNDEQKKAEEEEKLAALEGQLKSIQDSPDEDIEIPVLLDRE